MLYTMKRYVKRWFSRVMCQGHRRYRRQQVEERVLRRQLWFAMIALRQHCLRLRVNERDSESGRERGGGYTSVRGGNRGRGGVVGSVLENVGKRLIEGESSAKKQVALQERGKLFQRVKLLVKQGNAVHSERDRKKGKGEREEEEEDDWGIEEEKQKEKREKEREKEGIMRYKRDREREREKERIREEARVWKEKKAASMTSSNASHVEGKIQRNVGLSNTIPFPSDVRRSVSPVRGGISSKFDGHIHSQGMRLSVGERLMRDSSDDEDHDDSIL